MSAQGTPLETPAAWKERNSADACCFSSLSFDIQALIFSYFSPRQQLLVVSRVSRRWRSTILRSMKLLPQAGLRATAACLLHLLSQCENLERLPPAVELPRTVFNDAAFWQHLPHLRIREHVCYDPKSMSPSALLAYESWLRSMTTLTSLEFPLSSCVRFNLRCFPNLTRLTLGKTSHPPHLLNAQLLPSLREIHVQRAWTGPFYVATKHFHQLTSLVLELDGVQGAATNFVSEANASGSALCMPSLEHLTLHGAILERFLIPLLAIAPALKTLSLRTVNVTSPEVLHRIEPLLVEYDVPVPDLSLYPRLTSLILHTQKHPRPWCWQSGAVALRTLRITSIPRDTLPDEIPHIDAPHLSTLILSMEISAAAVSWLLDRAHLPLLSHLSFATFHPENGAGIAADMRVLIESRRFPSLAIATLKLVRWDKTSEASFAAFAAETLGVLQAAREAGLTRVQLTPLFGDQHRREFALSMAQSPWLDVVYLPEES